MHRNQNARLWVQVQHAAFVVLIVALAVLLARLADRHALRVDWTAAGSNSLSEASRHLLARMPDPVRVTAYAREDQVLRRATIEILDRYGQVKPDMTLEFVDPDTVPDRVRELGISVDGELVVEYQGRSEHVRELREAGISNALLRVRRAGERWVAFLTGHGERDLLGKANHDLGQFGARLSRLGYRLRGLNLTAAGLVPDNTDLLIVSQPEVPLFPAEVEALAAYIARGGNLLWLAEPQPAAGLEPIARALGITFHPGTVVEPGTRRYGLDNPAFALAFDYPGHAVTAGFDLMTLFPLAAALEAQAIDGWRSDPLVRTSTEAWTEKEPLDGVIEPGPGEATGPLALALALERPRPAPSGAATDSGMTQRVAVVGDGDFLANAYLGNGGNLDLGLGLVQWLGGEDALLEIPARIAPDLALDLTPGQAAAIALGSLFGAPLVLLGLGAAVHLRRRHR